MLPDLFSTPQTALAFDDETELRAQDNITVDVSLVDGVVRTNAKDRSLGLSARVRKNGVYGFASTPLITPEQLDIILTRARENASFLSRHSRLNRALHDVRQAHRVARDIDVPGDETDAVMALLHDIDGYIKAHAPKVVSRTVSASALTSEKDLLTSDNVRAQSLLARIGIHIALTAESSDGALSVYAGQGGRGGLSDIPHTLDDYKVMIDTLYDQLMRKVEGVYVKPGKHTVVLDADLAGILAHEAIGHTVEGDIVYGGSIAGALIGQPVASELVTLIDFANEAYGKPCPIPLFVDDEGTVARDAVLIDQGVLTNFMHNRETAAIFGHTPLGNARAFGYNDEPLVRMRNTAFAPGTSSFEDMIASVDEGYYLKNPTNGQADSTSEFMFGVCQGYEIKNGKLGRAIRDTTVSGVAFDVLKTVSMVSDTLSWGNQGMGWCGKKQPAAVGMGGPAIKCVMTLGGH